MNNWQRFRYRIDEFFARGAFYILFAPAVAAVLVLLLAALAVKLLTPTDSSLGALVWTVLLRMLDPGVLSGDAGNKVYMTVMLLVTLSGILLISLLIGMMSTWLETHLSKLRKGRSFVPESGHILILGWSRQVFLMLNELLEADLPDAPTVVVLAYEDKAEMDDRVRDRVLNKHKKVKMRVVCRHGNPMDPHDLQRVNPGAARSVIILPNEDYRDDNPDIYVVKVIMALARAAERRLPVIAPVFEPESASLLRELHGDHQIYPVVIRDMIARITAQTALQSGLSYIYEDLLNFEGDEIYYTQRKANVALWKDVPLTYETAVALGLRRGADILLNPAPDEPVYPDDEIIVIASTERAVQPDGAPAPLVRSEFFALPPEDRQPPPKKVLLLGWNNGAPFLLRYMLDYLPPDSSVRVVTRRAVEEVADVQGLHAAAKGVLHFEQQDVTRRQVLERLHPEDYDHVVVLSDDTDDVQHADARTLMVLLHLRDILRNDDTPFTLVSEMRDMQNRYLAEIANVDDFIISDHIASLTMVQLAVNPGLWSLYDELFAPRGSEVYLKPISDYVQTGVPVNFYTLTAAAMRYGETALGYRLADEVSGPNFGIYLNPRKTETRAYKAGDVLIVLAEN